MHVLQIDYNAANARKQFSESLRKTGFAVLEKHPVSWEFVAEIYQEWIAFFASNDKMKYCFKRETQDGFFPQSVSEKAKGAEVKDIKEYYQYYPWGQYPQEISQKTKILYQQLSDLASILLDWLQQEMPAEVSDQLSMSLPAMIEKSSHTMLRILHYPPLTGREPKDAVRAAAHEDINLLTLLIGATDSGLQVRDIHGHWHDVPGSSHSIIVNVGDMLSLATRSYYHSTTHRVVNPNGNNRSRLSMPLFLHPRAEVFLSADKNAGEYLRERLQELGVL